MTFRTQTKITGSAPSPKRVFFHHSKMEEYASGMWGELPIELRQDHINQAAELMRNVPEFRLACMRVLDEWPNSCAVAMTTPSMNLKAWIGHAAMCLMFGTPEHLTRQGWRLLTEEEQDAANAAAYEAVEKWRERNA